MSLSVRKRHFFQLFIYMRCRTAPLENPKIMHIKNTKTRLDENNYIQNITYLTIAGLTVSHYNKFNKTFTAQ